MNYKILRIASGYFRNNFGEFKYNYNYPSYSFYLFDENDKHLILSLSVINSSDGNKLEKELKIINECDFDNKLPYYKCRYYKLTKNRFLYLPPDFLSLNSYTNGILSWNDINITIDKTYLVEDKKFRYIENPLNGEFISRKLHDDSYNYTFSITPEAGH